MNIIQALKQKKLGLDKLCNIELEKSFKRFQEDEKRLDSDILAVQQALQKAAAQNAFVKLFTGAKRKRLERAQVQAISKKTSTMKKLNAEYNTEKRNIQKDFALQGQELDRAIGLLRVKASELREKLEEIDGDVEGIESNKKAVIKIGDIAMDMILIPMASFKMGAPETDKQAQFDEKPQHQVAINTAYWISTKSVPQELFQVVTKADPSRFKGDKNPVERISWCDAIVFCNQLSLLEGRREVYQLPKGFQIGMDRQTAKDMISLLKVDSSADGYRLPTEAEWENAARGGAKKSPKSDSNELDLSAFEGALDTQPKYAGSPHADTVAWYRDNSDGKTHPCGEKEPNGYGLYDMSGNVWEWVWDWKSRYGKSPVIDPQGPENGTEKVIRGGSWFEMSAGVRITHRMFAHPGYQSDRIGFRIVRSSKRR